MSAFFAKIKYKYLFLFVFLLFLGVPVRGIHAQDGDIPPPLNPYDPMPSSPDLPTLPTDPGMPGGNPMDPGMMPPMPDGGGEGGFDPFAEEGGFGGGGGDGRREGKESFRYIEQSANQGCSNWTNPLLGKKKYDDFSTCRMDLERLIERGRMAIERNVDDVERFKLKKVIRGTISKEESKTFGVQFQMIEKKLMQARREGCVCKK